MTCVSMGKPHAVIFTDNIDSLDLEKIGPHFENHELFPNRVNRFAFQPVQRGHHPLNSVAGPLKLCSCFIPSVGWQTSKIRDPLVIFLSNQGLGQEDSFSRSGQLHLTSSNPRRYPSVKSFCPPLRRSAVIKHRYRYVPFHT